MTQLGSFPGGLLLDGQKRRSTQTAIRTTPISKKLILPMQQHIGEAAQEVVSIAIKC